MEFSNLFCTAPYLALHPFTFFKASSIEFKAFVASLTTSNLSIPKDVSIIVFDKLTKMEVEGIQISEVVFPAFDIGANTSKVLLEQKSPASLKQIYNYSGRFYLRGSENKE